MSDIKDYDDKKLPTANVTVLEADQDDHEKHIDAAQADGAAALVAGFDASSISPEEFARVRRKIDLHLLPMMMILYFVQFMDKTTLGNSANLGIKSDNHLSALQYNWLGSIFYLAYLLFEWPQNLALQRFPAGRWMSFNVLCWSVFLLCQAACSSFAGLFVCRLGLGVCEGSITAGFMIITSMFYTHAEASRRVSYWFLMNGFAQIVSGLLSFAVLHAHSSLSPWRIFMLITGGITLVVGLWFLFCFPDSPMTARFLTEREKIVAIERIRSNRSGVENKTWKKEQFIEALVDPKTWLFALFAALDNVPNSLTNQNAIIIKSWGFSTLNTTLLGCVSGVVEIITIASGALCMKRWPNSRAWISIVYFIPNILGSALILALPSSNKVGQLISLYITGVGTTGFVLSLAWISSVTTGHTKKGTTNAIFLIFYCLGNLCAPQMWKAEYAPRNTVPWSVILACYSACPILILAIYLLLRKENARRDALPPSIGGGPGGNSLASSEEGVWIDGVGEDGEKTSRKIEGGDDMFSDQTDRQNLRFRYVL